MQKNMKIKELNKIKTPNLLTGISFNKKEEILNYFHNTFSLYEKLFETLATEESYYIKPDPLRHPLIFYYGHTAVFFINKLTLAGMIETRVNEDYESIFAIGVDEMAWDDLDEKNYNWPSVNEVKEYREKVRQIVSEVIQRHSFDLPITWNSKEWVFLMGIEHERIHLETSSVLIRQLPIQHVYAHPEWLCYKESNEPPNNNLVQFDSKKVQLNRPDDYPFYGWDNEYGNHTDVVDSFKISQYLVSNGEFKTFIAQGGYKNIDFWSEEGWKWRSYLKAELPRFWLEKGGTYFLRTMVEEIPMPWDWPCEVNFHEAKAFCNWLSKVKDKKIRLPSESEWMVLRHNVCDTESWETKALGNIDLKFCASSVPVNKHNFNGVFDVIGNVWQWTESTINGYKGFKTHPLYDDFSVPTFDNQHCLIKGGSWISTGNETTKFARYAFRKHFYQHCGFRYVQSDKEVINKTDTYESDPVIMQYMDFHYGPDYFGVANFTKKLAEICLQLNGKRHRALDIGCALGRASFELGKAYSEVLGIDFSARFIQIASELKKTGRARYQIPTEGDLQEYRQIDLSDAVELNDSNHIHFYQGDACNLSKKYGKFDLILAANLIDWLDHPEKFLTNIGDFLNPEGYLVLASPYTWKEKSTKKKRWLGGFKGKDGENVQTLATISKILSNGFSLVQKPRDVEFVVRETKRKYQHSLSEVTIWQMKK